MEKTVAYLDFHGCLLRVARPNRILNRHDQKRERDRGQSAFCVPINHFSPPPYPMSRSPSCWTKPFPDPRSPRAEEPTARADTRRVGGSGTDGLRTLRRRELDSNFPYAGAMNLVFAPFVSRSIVRVLPEAHPTMAMRVTRPTRLAISPKATEHTRPTLVPPAMEAIIVGTSLRKLGLH